MIIRTDEEKKADARALVARSVIVVEASKEEDTPEGPGAQVVPPLTTYH